MKLFCSTKLQKRLGICCEKAPIPQDLLDGWYANVIQLRGRDTVVAILPELRFCVVAWKVPEEQWSNLGQVVVQAIRKTLMDPMFSIPWTVVDAYMPPDTVFELCSTADRGYVTKMGAVTTRLQDSRDRWYYLDFEYEDEEEDDEFFVNRGFVHMSDGRIMTENDAMRTLLQQRYPDLVPPIELEISLDQQQFKARRTLVIPGGPHLGLLQEYLLTAFRWDRRRPCSLILPARALEGDAGPSSPSSGGDDTPDEFSSMANYIQVGDTFRFLYGGKNPWELVVRVSRCVPNLPDRLPLCTLCEGAAPSGLKGTVGRQDSAEAITVRLRAMLRLDYPAFLPS